MLQISFIDLQYFTKNNYQHLVFVVFFVKLCGMENWEKELRNDLEAQIHYRKIQLENGKKILQKLELVSKKIPDL